MLATTILIIFLVLLLFLIAFLLIRTMMFGKPIPPAEPVEGIKVDSPVIAEHLANVIRKATISNVDPEKVDPAPFLELHQTLEAMYPRVHATLERRVINGGGLLYTWKGRKPDLEPLLFAGHLDVVPVEAAGLSEWEHPPFSGHIEGGFVWGRGTLDMKSHVVCLLEAVENLLKDGYRPARTLYLAFGHDEEVGGTRGAAVIAKWLEDEGVHLAAVLDEGGAIIQELVPGIKSPTAVVGLAEKGYLTLELVVQGQPGHSSMPPDHTAIGILGAALARLEANPMPAYLNAFMPMIEAVGGVLPFSMQLLFGNRWLFGGAIRKRMLANPQTAASIRTTQAVTMISGGIKENLIPREARARVNFRLLPGDSIADVCNHVRKAINDERVQFQPVDEFAPREASPVSPVDSFAFTSLAKVIRQIYPEAVVAPYLVQGATDSRYYTPVCEHVYRFSPGIMDKTDLARVHGTNERIAIADLGRMVQFFGQVIRVWGEEQNH